MQARNLTAVLLGAAGMLSAQGAAPLQDILNRLERLERENQSLRQEVESLRQEVAGMRGTREVTPTPLAPVEEQLAIEDARIKEHEQEKVSASQRFPLRITGMALFNLFANGASAGRTDQPLIASRLPGVRTWGGSLRQSIVGLDYDGPATVWGGKVRGSLAMDFYGGSGQSLDSLLRIRTASISIDWKNRSLMVGQDKPLFAPRSPTSYAEVGVPPLSGAGNLWRWEPQVRFEQRLGLGHDSGLRAQLGFIQTSEDLASSEPNHVYSNPYGSNALADEHRRPGVEGRFELWHRIDDTRRLEIAPGFHFSRTQILGNWLPSNLFSVDWFFNPIRRLEISGSFFSGQNIGYFGGPHPGFTLLRGGQVIAVHSQGGWAQFSVPVTSRLAFNFYGGEQNGRSRDLVWGDAGLNRAGASNLVYRLAPNVIVSLETQQIRTTYLGLGRRINNHYDLAVAYLF